MKKNYFLGIRRFWFLLILSILSCSGAEDIVNRLPLREQKSINDKLSMVFTFPGAVDKWTAENISLTYGTLKKAGIGISNLYYTWADIEEKKGVYNWRELDFNIAVIKKHDMKISLEIKIIDTNKIGQLPEEIVFSSFDDAHFKKRFADFVLLLLDRYDGYITYLWIGNEIDGFLYDRREFLEGWLLFYREIYGVIKYKYPHVKIGTISTFHDARNNGALDIIEKSGSIGDLIGFSFYPQMLQDAKRGELLEYFEEMSAIAKKLNKKSAITESGWSSEGVNGSEDMQARFITELITLYREFKTDIEYLGLFVVYDFPESVNKMIASEYGLEEQMEFLVFQGTLGLAYNNRKPKQAWYALTEAIGKRDINEE
jgi:hypothetical protein